MSLTETTLSLCSGLSAFSRLSHRSHPLPDQAKTKRATIFKRAEQYVKEYRKAEADELRLARDARKHGNFYVPSEAKLAIVMRIRGINGLHPRVRKVCIDLLVLRYGGVCL